MKPFPILGFTATFFGSPNMKPRIVFHDISIRTRTERVYYMFKRVVWYCPLPPIDLAMGTELDEGYVARVEEITREYFSGGSWLNRKIGSYTEDMDSNISLVLRCAWLTNALRAIDVVESRLNIWDGKPCTNRFDFILRLRKLAKRLYHPGV